jgi:hypothetical protein
MRACVAESSSDPNAGDGDAHRDRRPNPLIEEIGFEKDLTVGNGDDVGRDVGRHVTGLRLDDRERRQRAVAEPFAHSRCAFQQSAVQVEDVARIGLAAGWALQDQ